MYLDYLKDKQKNKLKNSKHSNEVEYTFEQFNEYLLEQKILPSLNVELLTKVHSDGFKEYLKKEYPYHGATLNNKFRKMTSFVLFLNKNGFQIFNPFTSRVTENKSKDYISADEFYKLIDYIPNGSTHHFLNTTGERKKKYFPWLADAFELGVRTGLRRAELCNLKFSDIVCINGEPKYFWTENLKVNNRNEVIHDDDKQMKFVPITKKTLVLLNRIGLDKYKGTHRYIIAPDDDRSRENTILDNLSRGFSHFYTELFGKRKCFKSLRSTFITRAYLFTLRGRQVNQLTDHSTMEILFDHYLNSEEMAIDFAERFEVF